MVEAGKCLPRMTPFMFLLLPPAMADDLAAMKRIDLRDLKDASPETLARVERLVRAVKSLVQDLIDSGGAAMGTRLRAHLGQAPDKAALIDLTGGLSRDVMVALQSENGCRPCPRKSPACGRVRGCPHRHSLPPPLPRRLFHCNDADTRMMTP
ncbi:MAG: hypothetical protein FD153_479 [Rhodospirillaceae bacterium]|nr:MAG: hypothetical protein FD153_479 [Rhodospirillaceae bacterium]